VPVTFAVDGQVVYSPVDAKPKRGTALKRLANVSANPAVALLCRPLRGVSMEVKIRLPPGQAEIVRPNPTCPRRRAMNLRPMAAQT
jgi:hypothetical protein